MNDFSKALCHHGIRNQRWGVRNGPPYPLDRKTHKRIVKGRQDKEIRRSDRQKHGISHVTVGSRGFRAVENFEGVEREFKRDGQTWYRTYGSGKSNLAEIIGRGGDDEAAWRTLDRPGHKVTSEDLLAVNQQRFYQGPKATHDGFLDPGLYNNCGMCSAAMFLRGLGYDVQAGRTDSGVLNTAHQYWFDGAKQYKAKGAQALYEQMQSFGNQGKGVLSIRHKNGGGHAVYFQMEKQADGKLRPTIYDGQVAKKYDSLSQFLREENADMTQFSRVTRLDGATPNWKHLAEDGDIRANVDRYWDPSGESRIRGLHGEGYVQDKKGNSYLSENFSYVGDKDFQRENARDIEISKSGQYWTSDARGDLWRYSTDYLKSQEQAGKDREAREFLKKKYGIGG